MGAPLAVSELTANTLDLCRRKGNPRIEYGTQVTSPGDRDGAQPIDPDFAGLFRPDDEPVAEPAPAVAPSPSAPDMDVEPSAAAPEQPAAESAPPPASPPVDTGRLFRSQGVSDHPDAVLALSSDHFGRLRTLKRDKGDDAAAPAPTEGAATSQEEAVHAVVVGSAATALDQGDLGPLTIDDQAVSGRRSDRRSRGSHEGRTIGAGAVYLIVIGVTVLVGFANALLSGGSLGWPTGVALVISSVYAALTVRRDDDTVAFLTPPVAFFLAALTAGQVFVDSLEGSLLNRAVILFFTLADNWYWIIGATAAALVIVLVRRRR